MSALIKLALALFDGGAMRLDDRSTARMECVVIATGVAVLAALGALACLLTALWIYALPYVGEVGAPAVVAAALLILCFALLVTIRYAPKSRRPSPASLEGAPAQLLADATRLIAAHKVPVIIAAMVAGLIVGRSER